MRSGCWARRGVRAAGSSSVWPPRVFDRSSSVATLRDSRRSGRGSTGADAWCRPPRSTPWGRRFAASDRASTVWPFARTGVPLARACLPVAASYVDLANDLEAVPALLALDREAVAAGSAVLPGAGFGFVATESLVARVCAGRPAPKQLRVEAIPSFELQEGRFGEALAATFIEGIPSGGRRYADGRLVSSAVGGAGSQPDPP